MELTNLVASADAGQEKLHLPPAAPSQECQHTNLLDAFITKNKVNIAGIRSKYGKLGALVKKVAAP